jgi:hypothetical protein
MASAVPVLCRVRLLQLFFDFLFSLGRVHRLGTAEDRRLSSRGGRSLLLGMSLGSLGKVKLRSFARS